MLNLPQSNLGIIQALMEKLSLDINPRDIPKLCRVHQNEITSLNLSMLNINNLKNVKFLGLESLEELDLSYNNIESIESETFVLLVNLKKLKLSHNNISTIEETAFQSLTNLEELSLSHNKLKIGSTSIFKPLINIRKLILGIGDASKSFDLSFNYFQNFKIVKHAKFQNQNVLKRITSEMFEPFKNIEILDLENLKIDSIENKSFAMNRKLKALYLKSNNILSLSIDLFENNLNLELLDLSHNYINEIENDFFYNCINLVTLLLNNNNLNSLPQSLNTLYKLRCLNLQDNKFTSNWNKNFKTKNITQSFLANRSLTKYYLRRYAIWFSVIILIIIL